MTNYLMESKPVIPIILQEARKREGRLGQSRTLLISPKESQKVSRIRGHIYY